ncbi:MAG: ABC transporter [Acidobacteria bacterium 21-70-11]|nr:MAG: ABC transporter [Acidobacteria bacterium 21-70-11]HQT93684.1 ABC transporter ATP-binding protein [Thermoanaerobaculaceae bacterium]HQU32727.1 ABC transporter ATP-binding protein [Thermoanaerobaculaceae bacterium]
MSAPAIRVSGLGKRYRIGERLRYKSLRESVSNAVTRTFRGGRRAEETIWALKDVSFELALGEVVGVIGRNGAGKSTLLKVLSRITEPTEGRVELNGRVGSLLEVGTGFHLELTGRENIYLNGAILGMKRAEIDRKFDEIVAFAEVERFLDTPVKHYSTGMYLRLAFAVAAHLEPEILLVDEVLAVGDAAFQKKCLGKMETVGREGRTVVFVSHSMSAITRLCQRGLLLDAGRVVLDGSAGQAAATYMRSDLGTTAARRWDDTDWAPGDGTVRLRAVCVRTREGAVTDVVDIGAPVAVEIEYDVLRPGEVLVPNLHFFNEDGTCVFILHDSDPAWRRRGRPVGRYTSKAWIPGNLLAEGTLVVGAAVSTHDPLVIHLYERDAVAFQVVDNSATVSARGDYAGFMPGVVRPLVPWETDFAPAGDPRGAAPGEGGR